MTTVRFYRNTSDTTMSLPGVGNLAPGMMSRQVAEEFPDIDLNVFPGLTQIDQQVQAWEDPASTEPFIFDPGA